MKKIYITTAIPYVNAEPHIGFALEAIQADAIARYQRLIGNDIFFVSGADENSLKNVLAAEAAGQPVKDFVDAHSARFLELKKALNLSLDDFIRTTEKRHILAAQKIWQAASEDIYEGQYEGLYCVGCEDFFKEDDLVEGLCPDHKTRPELITEKNYFFALSRYQDFLVEAIKKEMIKIIPESRKPEILNFAEGGLRDFSVSRSRERARNWGISVPGDESQAIYVWFDALTNYISALGYGVDGPLFRAWWEDETTEVWHFIGKNITKFHCLYWPAMLKSAGLRLPSRVIVHGFITSEGEKMSKSLGNVLNPFDLVEEWGTDVIRYYLLREFSLSQDGDFQKTGLLERYNGELANGLGNLFSRVLAMADKEGGKISISADSLKEGIETTWRDYRQAMDGFQMNRAAEAFLRLAGRADAFINEKKPWEMESGEEKNGILSSLWLVLANISLMVQPFMPETSIKMKEAIGLLASPNLPVGGKGGPVDFLGQTFQTKKIPPLFLRK